MGPAHRVGDRRDDGDDGRPRRRRTRRGRGSRCCPPTTSRRRRAGRRTGERGHLELHACPVGADRPLPLQPGRQAGAEQQRRYASVGAEVGPVQDRRASRRSPSRRRRRPRTPPWLPTTTRSEPRRHHSKAPSTQRPHQVELLLDGQAPRVAQRRRGEEGVPVALLAEDGPPVGDVEDGAERVAPEPAELGRIGEQPGVERHRRPVRRRGPAAAAEPGEPRTARGERHPSPNRSRTSRRRDQEAREHEEQVDAEEAALEEVDVEHDDPGHRQAAQTIEGIDVGQAERRRRSRGNACSTIGPAAIVERPRGARPALGAEARSRAPVARSSWPRRRTLLAGARREVDAPAGGSAHDASG